MCHAGRESEGRPECGGRGRNGADGVGGGEGKAMVMFGLLWAKAPSPRACSCAIFVAGGCWARFDGPRRGSVKGGHFSRSWTRWCDASLLRRLSERVPKTNMGPRARRKRAHPGCWVFLPWGAGRQLTRRLRNPARAVTILMCNGTRRVCCRLMGPPPRPPASFFLLLCRVNGGWRVTTSEGDQRRIGERQKGGAKDGRSAQHAHPHSDPIGGHAHTGIFAA